MAKQQALRELQQRIARLLQQAADQRGRPASWLGVSLNGKRLLLPLQQAGEIYAIGPIQPLPYAKPWFAGVTALRGNVYGVVELSAFLPELGTEPIAIISSSKERSRQRFVAINEAFGLNVVFRVDALEGLHSSDTFVRSQPADAQALPHWGSVFFDKTDVAWQEINLLALTQNPSFIDIATETGPAKNALDR